jgi:thiopurine S-methyltransferase
MNLTVSIESLLYSILSLQSMDESITLYACNIFALTPEMVGPIDYVFDRGSIVAIQAEDRVKYIKLMRDILEGRPFRYLACTYDYDQSVFPGPPRSIPEKEVGTLFGD